MSGFTVEARAFRPGDEDELHAALERSRAATSVRALGMEPGAGAGASGETRTLAELRWRYAHAPHGACIALARDAQGTPVAGIAATRHRALLEGQPVSWLEVGDLFNDFARGAGLSRARGLVAAGRAFAEEFGGFAPEKHPLMYGVPNRRAHRIGLRCLDWEVLRSENQLALDLSRPQPRIDAELELEEVERFPPGVEQAFRAHATGRPAILVRDATYLDWRYADRPGAGFQRVVARRAGAVAGCAVHAAGWLLESIAPLDDAALTAALLGWAAGCARAEGRTQLAAIVPDTAPEWLAFQRLGFRVRGTREYLCFRSFQRPAIMSWLFHHWSYTRGDTLR